MENEELDKETAGIREVYATDAVMGFREEDAEEFDQWLTKVRADAWDEGFDAGEADVWNHVTFDEDCTENPYREKNDEIEDV
jgi:hypothetical protein